MAALAREAALNPLRELGDGVRSVQVENIRPMQLKDFVQVLYFTFSVT